MNAPAVMRRGRRSVRRAADSTMLEGVARTGMVAQGVLYILVGLAALRIAFGDGGSGGGGQQADQSGAWWREEYSGVSGAELAFDDTLRGTTAAA